MVIPGNVYVIMMPKDIPESRIHGKIAPLKNYFPAPKPPSNLLYHNTFNSLKKYAPPPPMFEYTSIWIYSLQQDNVCKSLELCRQSAYYSFFANNIIISTLNVL